MGMDQKIWSKEEQIRMGAKEKVIKEGSRGWKEK